jgi:hypothetical protein
MSGLLPGSATRTWLDHLKDEFDYQTAEVERYRAKAAEPGSDKALQMSRAYEAEAHALHTLKLITDPFKGLEGHRESDPVPTLNRWLRERGLAGLTVYCSHCHQSLPGLCRCFGPPRAAIPATIKTVADQFPGCFGER